GSVALHNGIIVNDRKLVTRYALSPQSELDSEVLAAVLRKKLDDSKDLVAATRATFAEIEGAASISMLFDDFDVMLLATNTGSVFPARGRLSGGRRKRRQQRARIRFGALHPPACARGQGAEPPPWRCSARADPRGPCARGAAQEPAPPRVLARARPRRAAVRR